MTREEKMKKRNSKIKDRIPDYALENEIFNAKHQIKQNPSNAEAYYNRGWAYAYQGKFKKAVSNLSKAITINARFIDAYYSRALVYFELKKYSECLKDIFMLSKLDNKMLCSIIESLMIFQNQK